jgi:hypothetical protein
MRLRSDIWVAAYLRRCGSEGVFAALRRRGSPEAGAIFIKIDRLDGTSTLYGPAPQSEAQEDGLDRLFLRAHKEEWLDSAEVEARLLKQIAYDSDLWIVEAEDRAGRHFLDLAKS